MLGAPRRQVTFPATFCPLADRDPGAKPQEERGTCHQGNEQARHAPLMPRLGAEGKRDDRSDPNGLSCVGWELSGLAPPMALRMDSGIRFASPGQRAEHALDADGESEDGLRDRVIDDAERGGEIDGAHHLDSMKRLASVATRSL